MKFAALVGAAAAINTQKAYDLHDQMASFVQLVGAVETHDQDVVFDAVSARKDALKEVMLTKDATEVAQEYKNLLALVKRVEVQDFEGALDELEMRKDALMGSYHNLMNEDLVVMDGGSVDPADAVLPHLDADNDNACLDPQVDENWAAVVATAQDGDKADWAKYMEEAKAAFDEQLAAATEALPEETDDGYADAKTAFDESQAPIKAAYDCEVKWAEAQAPADNTAVIVVVIVAVLAVVGGVGFCKAKKKACFAEDDAGAGGGDMAMEEGGATEPRALFKAQIRGNGKRAAREALV